MNKEEIKKAKEAIAKAKKYGFVKIPKREPKRQENLLNKTQLFRHSQCGEKVEPYLREYYRYKTPNVFEVIFSMKVLAGGRIVKRFHERQEAVDFRNRFLHYFVNWTETGEDPEGLFTEWDGSIHPDNPAYKRMFQKIYQCIPELKN